MSSPLNDSGATSRRIQRQVPAAASGGAVIGLYLINAGTSLVVNILRYALSHPTRMYEVGFYIWAIPTLVAFVQGAFRIGGTVATHPVTMYLLVGFTMVMHAQCSILENLHKKTEEWPRKHLALYTDGLESEIALLTILLWGCVALAIWWSPDTTVLFNWLGLSGLKSATRECWYELIVTVVFQIILGNYAVRFLISNRINNYSKAVIAELRRTTQGLSNQQIRSALAHIESQRSKMLRELRVAQKKEELGTLVIIAASAVIAGIYWFIIWYFHNYKINWAVL